MPVLRSANPAHQRENLDVFDFALENNEIAAINELNQEDGRIDGQDPNEYEKFE